MRPGVGWGVSAHLGFFVFCIGVPLFVMKTEGRKDAWTRRQAVEAFNFQATLLTVWVPLTASFFVGQAFDESVATPILLLMAVIYVGGIFSSAIAAAHAARGEDWRYPIAITFLR
jgi:uncharacterized Tic20 family protein